MRFVDLFMRFFVQEKNMFVKAPYTEADFGMERVWTSALGYWLGKFLRIIGPPLWCMGRFSGGIDSGRHRFMVAVLDRTVAVYWRVRD